VKEVMASPLCAFVSLWLIHSLCFASTISAADARLADAAQNRNGQAVRSLIKQGFDVNAPQPDGTTALHWVARWNDLETAGLLVQRGANAKAANRIGATPLYLAAVNGSAAMIELLLKAGADPNVAMLGGETALMTAANTGSLDAVRVLLKNGADVNAKEKVKGQSALMWAAAENHAPVVKLLIENGADILACTNIDLVNSTNGFIISGPGVPTLPCARGGKPQPRPEPPPAAEGARGRGGRGGRPPGPPLGGSGGGAMTPFLFAVRANAMDSIRILMDAGSDVNQTMADGTSAMVVAIINGHYGLAKYLMDKGADPNLADLRGRAALYAAVDMRNYRWSELPKPPGDDLDELDLIKALLARGANPNARITSPIPYRGPSNFSNVFQSMVGATPFLRAVESGDTTVMRLLVFNGADPNIKLADNTTALMLASGVGRADGSTFEWSEEETLDAVKLCLQFGNSLQAANNAGLTALHGAAHRGSNATVEFLVKMGAKLDAKDAEERTPLNWAEGVAIIDQRPPRPQPHTVALLQQLMTQSQSR
jgi:ankyrin repeat protein